MVTAVVTVTTVVVRVGVSVGVVVMGMMGGVRLVGYWGVLTMQGIGMRRKEATEEAGHRGERVGSSVCALCM